MFTNFYPASVEVSIVCVRLSDLIGRKNLKKHCQFLSVHERATSTLTVSNVLLTMLK